MPIFPPLRLSPLASSEISAPSETRDLPDDGLAPLATLESLLPGQCKWPYGTSHSCGRPQATVRVTAHSGSSPYCPEHTCRAYRKVPAELAATELL